MLVTPVYLLFKKLKKSYSRERRFLIYLLMFGLINTIFIIDYLLDTKIKFCICFWFMINIMFLIEALNGTLIAKIVPSDWRIGPFTVGTFISLVAASGRALGSFMQTISASIVGEEYMILLTFSSLSFIFLIIIIAFIVNYSELRLKAISRILKNQSYNKV
jgi:hypothetical protein